MWKTKIFRKNLTNTNFDKKQKLARCKFDKKHIYQNLDKNGIWPKSVFGKEKFRIRQNRFRSHFRKDLEEAV